MSRGVAIGCESGLLEGSGYGEGVESKYLIYGLIDPRTLLIRYVGLSAKGMKRPRQHWYPTNRGRGHKGRWIDQLEREGLRYEIVVLQASNKETLNDDERWWVAYGRALGWPLTNLTDGGEGNIGYVPTLETRAKMSTAQKGKKRDPEVVKIAAERSAATRRAQQKKRTPEQRARMSAARRNVEMTPEWRANLSKANLGRRASEAARSTMSKAQRARADLITHCPKGHEYTPENTAVYGVTKNCRTCRRERGRAVPRKGLIWDRYTPEQLAEFLKMRGQRIAEGRRRGHAQRMAAKEKTQ